MTRHLGFLFASFFMILLAVPAFAHGDEDHETLQTHSSMAMHEAVPAPQDMPIEIIPNWHPLLVHFTIALLLIASGLFVISRLAPVHMSWRANCLVAARWNLWLGSLITVGTVLAGWYAFNTVNHDEASHLVMLTHRLWALSTAGAFAALALWSVAARKKEPHVAFVLCLLLASMALAVTGYYGGELVFRHGLGVISIPPANEHEHHHHDHE